MQNNIASEIINQQIQFIDKSIQNLQPNLSRIIKRLQQYHLAYAIFLVSRHKFFDTLFTFNCKEKTTIIALCDAFNSSIFQLHSQNDWYKNIKAIRDSEGYKQQTSKKKYQRTGNQDKFYNFLTAVVEVIKSQGLNSVKLEQGIRQGFQIKIDQADNKNNFNPYEQYAANFLNFCLECVRRKIQTKTLCCKTIFFKQQPIQPSEGVSQQFKRYVWPIVNQSIRNHLAKTMIGFMNSKGGVIYIGIYENKDKKNQIIGIQLKQTQVQFLKDLIMQLVNTILPKHAGFETIKKQEYSSLSVGSAFSLNDFIKMQFMRVVDKKNYMNVEFRNQKKQLQSNLYIVKIVVKIGHPKHLYHVVNTQKNIDFFERPDRNVEKKPFPQAYKQIYRRLDQFQKAKQEFKKTKKQPHRDYFHPNCRYTMLMEHYLLKQDLEQEINDDDDDDDDDD